MNSINEILHIECADGNKLPYKGSGLQNSSSRYCLLLVSQDTSYSSSTPILLGTNILEELWHECEENFAKLHISWYLTFRTMAITAKNLEKNKGRIAIVKCASLDRITIRPNQSIDVPRYVYKELNYPTTTAMLQETEDSIIHPET